MSTTTVPQEYCGRLLRAGNTNCAGCGMSLSLQFIEQALGGDDLPMMVIPACCGIVTAGQFPTSAYGVPVAASTFASAPAVATGLSVVASLNDEDHLVMCWTGDGGTYDIGIATLSAAAERNENMIYVCYDNEIYGNTGGQRSSATPEGVKTTTTPYGKTETKKDIMGIMAAHRIPYAATLSVAHRDDFIAKFRRARRIRGFRFFHVLSPCPTGWKSEPGESVDLIQLAVRSGLFPVYEVFDGVRHRINVRPDGTPVEEYMKRQRRYQSALAVPDRVKERSRRREAGAVDPEHIKAGIKAQWEYLEAMEKAFPVGEE